MQGLLAITVPRNIAIHVVFSRAVGITIVMFFTTIVATENKGGAKQAAKSIDNLWYGSRRLRLRPFTIAFIAYSFAHPMHKTNVDIQEEYGKR